MTSRKQTSDALTNTWKRSHIMSRFETFTKTKAIIYQPISMRVVGFEPVGNAYIVNTPSMGTTKILGKSYGNRAHHGR